LKEKRVLFWRQRSFLKKNNAGKIIIGRVVQTKDEGGGLELVWCSCVRWMCGWLGSERKERRVVSYGCVRSFCSGYFFCLPFSYNGWHVGYWFVLAAALFTDEEGVGNSAGGGRVGDECGVGHLFVEWGC